MIYVLLAIVELFLSWLYTVIKPAQRKYVWFFACLLMWSLIAFRDKNCGTDAIGYVRGFQQISFVNWEYISLVYKKDTGFWYLAKALSMISTSWIWFFCATAFLSCFGVWNYLRRNTENPVFALFFFITLGNFPFLLTGMRQSIAMSFCLLSLQFVEKKKFLGFTALVLTGAACHKSAFLFLPTYWIVWRDISQKSILCDILVAVAIIFSYDFWLDQANEILGYSYGKEPISNGIIFYLILLGVLFVAFLAQQKRTYTVRDRINLNSAIVVTGMWTIRLFSRTIERPAMYWLTSIPVVIENSINDFTDKRDRNLFLIFLILLALGLFCKRMMGVHYQFCWGG